MKFLYFFELPNFLAGKKFTFFKESWYFKNVENIKCSFDYWLVQTFSNIGGLYLPPDSRNPVVTYSPVSCSIFNQFSSCHKTISDHHTKNFIT